MGPDRWVEVTRSENPHEAEGLARVRQLLPGTAPFRAWSNFEFRDGQGRWAEVDLLVLGRRRLHHLVELNYYGETLSGDDTRWVRDGARAVDNPLRLAPRKAQRLASRLQDELRALARQRGAHIPDPRSCDVPFVQEAVYLHNPQVRCLLTGPAAVDLFGIDGHGNEMGLPGLRDRLLEAATPDHLGALARGVRVAPGDKRKHLVLFDFSLARAGATALTAGQREQEGWPHERLLPLVAGLAELQPWVGQWHGEVDQTYGVSLAAFLREQLTNRAARVGRTLEQLKEWQPAPTRRGRSVRAGAGRGSSAGRVPPTLLGSDAGRS